MTTSSRADANYLNPLHEAACKLGLPGWLTPDDWAKRLSDSGVKCVGKDIVKLLKLDLVAHTDNTTSALGIYMRTRGARERFVQIRSLGAPRDNSTWEHEAPATRSNVLPDDLRDRAAAFVVPRNVGRTKRTADDRVRARARTPPPLPNTTAAAAPAAAPPASADGVDALPQLDAAAPATTGTASKRRRTTTHVLPTTAAERPTRPVAGAAAEALPREERSRSRSPTSRRVGERRPLRMSDDWLPGVRVDQWMVGRPQDDSSSRTFLLFGSDALTPVVTVSAKPQQGSPLVDVEVRVHRLPWDPRTKRWAHGPVTAPKHEASFIRLLVDLRAANFCPGVTKGDFPEERHEAFDEKLAQGVRRYALDIASGAAGPGVLGCRPGVGGCQDGAYVLESLGDGPRIVSSKCRLVDCGDGFQRRSLGRMSICDDCYPARKNLLDALRREAARGPTTGHRVDWAAMGGAEGVRPIVQGLRRELRAAKLSMARAKRRLETHGMRVDDEFGALVNALKNTDEYARDYPEGTCRRALMDS